MCFFTVKQNISILLILFTTVCSADPVSINVSAPSAVQTGEQFRLVFAVNAAPSSFSAPDMSDFAVLSGPNTSSSSSVQIINGKVSQSVEYSYTYILQAVKEGTFTIGAATVTVDKKNYSSRPVTIEVVKGKTRQQQPGSQQGQGGTTNQSSQEQTSDDDLYVRVLLNTTDIYRGEHVAATIKIYSRVNLSGINNVEYPSWDGFFKQDIETPPLTSLNRENVNGEIYGTGVLQRVLLFPQRSGKITLDPVKLECIVRQMISRQPRSIFDDFFGANYRDVKMIIESKPVTINVKSLPPNAPESFNGAVGRFNFKSSINKTQVKTNEPISLKVTVIGNGNIKLIEAPKIKFPPDFEVYDPEITINVKNSMEGAAGSKTFEYLIIPRHAGNFRLPPVLFSWFDLNTKSYKTASSGEFIIQVEKGEDDDTKQQPVMTGVSKEDLKFLGKDIQYIFTGKIQWKKRDNTLLGSQLFYLMYIIPFAFFILFIVVKRKQIAENANIALTRNRKANRMAKRRLKAAAVYMKKKEEEKFYDEIIKVLWGYISDKLMIPLASLTKDNALAEMRAKKIDEELISWLMDTINTCEFARYAPTAEKAPMQKMYKDTIDIISKIEQKI